MVRAPGSLPVIRRSDLIPGGPQIIVRAKNPPPGPTPLDPLNIFGKPDPLDPFDGWPDFYWSPSEQWKAKVG